MRIFRRECIRARPAFARRVFAHVRLLRGVYSRELKGYLMYSSYSNPFSDYNTISIVAIY